MSTSITTVNAKLIANATSFISGFEQASKAARTHGARIDGEMDKLARAVRKKFSGSSIGKDLLAGLGLGGGAAAIFTAGSYVKGLFDEREAANKEHEASLARQAALTEERFRLGLTEAEKVAELRKDAAETDAKRRAALLAGGGPDARKVVDELTEKYQRLNIEIAKGQTALDERKAAEVGDAIARSRDIDAELKAMGFEGTMGAFKVGAQQRNLAELIEERNRTATERLAVRGDMFTDPVVKAEKQIELGQKLILTQTRINELTAEHDRLASEAGATMAGAFEEAAFSGGRLSDVVSGLIDDLLRLAFREAVTGPMAGFFGGVFKSWFPARAMGGPVAGGMPYMVGERGPELFVPSAGGNIVPNHAMGGGNIYQIDARGTDESVVQRLSAALVALAGPGVTERRALSAHAGTLRRGGGAARALGA